MLTLMVEYSEVRERMHDVVDAVQQGRDVLVTHFGAPFARLCLYGPDGMAPRAWLEDAVRKGFDALAEEARHWGILPASLLH